MVPTLHPPAQPNTLWGLEPHQLHDRYWAAHGVQVVRVGQPSELVPRAEVFLLTDPRTLVMFPLEDIIEDFNWLKPQVIYLRLKDRRDRTYREFVITDDEDRFIGFRRAYDGADAQLGRVLMTCDPEMARCWLESPDVPTASRMIRRAIHSMDRTVRSLEGGLYDRTSEADTAAFIRALQSTWRTPDVTIPRARKLGDGIFGDAKSEWELPEDTTLVAPVWLGAGRGVPRARTVVGPATLFDEPEHRPPAPALNWNELTTVRNQFPMPRAKPKTRPFFSFFKRAFDICAALVGIGLTLPLYPLILAAIYIEDGRPFFFAHKRETRGGRVFGCIKFRSMRKNAEQLKKELAKKNQADGPQFFIENDPRLTRVGAFLRKYNFDEFPQFLNVLLGDMSMVGPRPSPRAENQYCPPWREARLSVRPGITGLWQVSRTRRAGCDFQEWIKYDLQYVEQASFAFDLRIIYQTIAMIFRKAGHN